MFISDRDSEPPLPKTDDPGPNAMSLEHRESEHSPQIDNEPLSVQRIQIDKFREIVLDNQHIPVSFRSHRQL